MPIIYKLFQKLEEDTLSISFYEASITQILKLSKDITGKENRPISFMNIDVKIDNKILSNQIHQYMKKIIHHDQIAFLPGSQGWFKIQNQSIQCTKSIG